jgi:hypothetical protein
MSGRLLAGAGPGLTEDLSSGLRRRPPQRHGTVGIVNVAGDAVSAFPLGWMAASAVNPLLVFLIRHPQMIPSGQPAASVQNHR